MVSSLGDGKRFTRPVKMGRSLNSEDFRDDLVLFIYHGWLKRGPFSTNPPPPLSSPCLPNRIAFSPTLFPLRTHNNRWHAILSPSPSPPPPPLNSPRPTRPRSPSPSPRRSCRRSPPRRAPAFPIPYSPPAASCTRRGCTSSRVPHRCAS